ncbi:MAG: tetratricopeptide repeat protein, partial [Thermoplasmata archaeon]
IFGDSVNIAARIEPLAEPGGICITEPVFGQVRNKIPNQLEKLEPKVLKNVRFPMDIYRVTLPWNSPTLPSVGANKARLAILPLANISPDPKDEYFADGLTEELISALSKIRDLRVIARTSVGQYKSTSKTVAQIGAELGVTSVLEGSVRKAGNRLRITLQLIDAGTQDHIWADSYDRELDDVFAIQTEIAEKTAGALRIELLGPERESIRKEPTTDLAAYHLYLKGVHASQILDGMEEAIHFFEEAIRNDPGFGEAYARLANTLIAVAGDTMPAGEAFPRAREQIDKALELDPDSSEAHTARGNLALQFDQDWGVAETEFKWAISLNPSNANAHYWYGWLLRAVGRYADAVKEFTTTTELDPLWPGPGWGLMTSQLLAGDFASPIARAEDLRDKHPERLGIHTSLGHLYAFVGRMDDARREAELSVGPVGRFGEWFRTSLWAQVGKTDEARHWLRKMEEESRSRYVSPGWIATIYASLGEREKAFEWLERNNGEGARSLWIHYQSAAWDSIRDDPRFRSMLENMRLPTEVGWARVARTGP